MAPNRRRVDYPNKNEKPNLKELGVSGTKLLAGLVFEEELPQLQGLNAYRTYNRMRLDPTGAAMLKAVEFPVRSARWFVEPFSDSPKDVERADFIHDMVYVFGSQSMDDIIREAYTNKPFGFAAMEIIYEVIDGGRWDGKIGWDKLAWRHPLTKWRWNMGEVDGRQQLVSMTQLAPPYYEQVDIPRNKLMLFTYNREGDNFDGTSIFRAGYKNWVFRDNLYRIQAVGLERAYQGVPVVTVPEAFSDEMAGLGKQIVTTLRSDEQAGVVIPANVGFEIMHWPLEGTAMQAAIEHHDTQILASSLAAFLKLGTKNVGSLALSQDQSELFLDALNGDANQFAETFNLDPGIPTLIRVNYKDADDMEMPKLAHGDIGERSLEKLGRTLMALGQWGFLTPDDATEDKLREMLDLPQREYDFEDRDLWDIITKAQPDFPNWRIGPRNFPARLRPGTLVPDPTDPRSAALMKQEQDTAGPLNARSKAPTPAKPATPVKGKTPVGGGKPTDGGPGDFSERMMDFSETYDRYMTEQEKLLDIVQANRWKRPKGRPTEETRIRMRLTEKFAEALDDIAPGRARRSIPDKPSIVLAKNRRPYVVRAAEASEPAPRRWSPTGPRRKAVERHTEPLKRLLIPARLRNMATTDGPGSLRDDTMQMGDQPGHPFRGNQYASGADMGTDELRQHLVDQHGLGAGNLSLGQSKQQLVNIHRMRSGPEVGHTHVQAGRQVPVAPEA
jgi:hypothetical protein